MNTFIKFVQFGVDLFFSMIGLTILFFLGFATLGAILPLVVIKWSMVCAYVYVTQFNESTAKYYHTVRNFVVAVLLVPLLFLKNLVTNAGELVPA